MQCFSKRISLNISEIKSFLNFSSFTGKKEHIHATSFRYVKNQGRNKQMLIIIATTQSIKAGMNILKRLNVKPNRFLSQQFWFLQFWLLPFAIWQARIVIFKLSEVKTKKQDLGTFNVDYQRKINFGL